MMKGNRVKRTVASLLAFGSLAAALPASGLASGGGTGSPPTNAEPGGGGH
jgi:hypothetical protein